MKWWVDLFVSVQTLFKSWDCLFDPPSLLISNCHPSTTSKYQMVASLIFVPNSHLSQIIERNLQHAAFRSKSIDGHSTVGIMCLDKVACLPVDYCFRALAR